MQGGAILKGLTHDFEPARPIFHLLPAEGGGVPIRIELAQTKALFYVKDYLGNRDFVARRHFDEVQKSGRKAVITFHDGESLWGTIADGDENADRFFFYPVDESDNNIRVFVMRSSLRDLRIVS